MYRAGLDELDLGSFIAKAARTLTAYDLTRYIESCQNTEGCRVLAEGHSHACALVTERYAIHLMSKGCTGLRHSWLEKQKHRRMCSDIQKSLSSSVLDAGNGMRLIACSLPLMMVLL